MEQWFYAENGQQRGPLAREAIVEMFRSGQLPADTLVWTEGLDQWQPARSVPNLMPSAPFPPPIPSPAFETGQRRDATLPEPVFLHVPIGRLVLLSILSSGLYEAYWIYKNWRYVKERDGLKMRPFWRGIFGVFFIHGIMKTIQNDERMNRLEAATFSAGSLATGWIVIMILGNLLGRADDIRINLLGMIIAFPSFLFLVPVQSYVNRANARINPRMPYTPWTTGHIVCLVVGLLIWLLVMAGLMLPA